MHASGQVIAYSLNWSREPERLTAALNAHLPFDVSIRHTQIVSTDFDPRFSAVRRRYAYSILVDPVRNPLKERTAWRVWPEPDFDRMNRVAEMFIGKRDFGAFGRAPISGGHTVRTISMAEWREIGAESVLVLEADAFLYRMVRRIVAANLQVGWGEKQSKQVEHCLSDAAHKWAGKLAPPQGLSLEQVYYEG